MTLNVNVNNQTTNNNIVNITAKSNIFNEVMPGKLLFILSNGDEITANYAANGIWWALYEFADAGDYHVNATYDGLEGVIINNATIIIRYDASVDVNNKTLNLFVEDTFGLIATTDPINLTVNFVSSNPSVVSVDKDGNVVAVGEGNAIITVSVGGDGKYVQDSTTVAVTVSKIPTSISVENPSINLLIEDSVNTGATLNPENAGNLTYASSDENIAIVKDGKIMALKEGDVIITVSFGGNYKYTEAENKIIRVFVKKLNATMDLSTEEITEGENATIGVTLPGDATGNVTTKVNGKTYTTQVNNGKANIIIPDLEYGNYTFSVMYSGDDKYNSLTKDVNLTVKEDKIIVSAPDLTKYYSGPERFMVNVAYANGRAISGKEVKITINGITYNRTTDENGSASLNINLNVGMYGVSVEVDNIVADSMVVVLSTINADDVESKTRNFLFMATFIDGEGNYLTKGTTVSFNINEVIYNSQITEDKGSASIDLTLDEGRYVIMSYNPITGEYASNILAVGLKDVVMMISNDEINVGENAIIRVTLPGDATGNVTASINGKTYTNQVNNGKANIIIPALAAGKYTVGVKYSGDYKYNGAKGDANVTVNKVNAAISVDAPVITVGQNATVTVTLPNDATGSVTVDNKVIPVKNCIASVVLTGLPVGITTVHITYSGDDKYNLIETSADVIVNKKPVPEKENLTIKATVDEITEGEDAVIVVSGLENATGNVSVVVNGKTYTALINNGQSVIIAPGLTENITALINYPGDDKYNPAVTAVNIAVKKNVIIHAENLTKYYNGSEMFIVKVTDAEGHVAPNKTVKITINGITYKRTTDEKGIAGLNINFNSGVYPVRVAVDGVEANYTVTVMSTI